MTPGDERDDHEPISDEELAAEAMAADPFPSLDHARSIHELIGPPGTSTLPEWYMPAIASGAGRVHGWRRATVFTFIAALLVIEAFGLCSTYGQFI